MNEYRVPSVPPPKVETPAPPDPLYRIVVLRGLDHAMSCGAFVLILVFMWLAIATDIWGRAEASKYLWDAFKVALGVYLGLLAARKGPPGRKT